MSVQSSVVIPFCCGLLLHKDNGVDCEPCLDIADSPTRILTLTRLFIQFILTGLIVAKSSIASPIQEALTNTLKIIENHNGRVAMHQFFTSTQKNTALQAVDKFLLSVIFML